MRTDITKDKLLLRPEKKQDTQHKMLIFNSAQLPKLQSYTVFLVEKANFRALYSILITIIQIFMELSAFKNEHMVSTL
jgi:hypothetical protein